jgi:hypothetical protein
VLSIGWEHDSKKTRTRDRPLGLSMSQFFLPRARCVDGRTADDARIRRDFHIAEIAWLSRIAYGSTASIDLAYPLENSCDDSIATGRMEGSDGR